MTVFQGNSVGHGTPEIEITEMLSQESNWLFCWSIQSRKSSSSFLCVETEKTKVRSVCNTDRLKLPVGPDGVDDQCVAKHGD